MVRMLTDALGERAATCTPASRRAHADRSRARARDVDVRHRSRSAHHDWARSTSSDGPVVAQSEFLQRLGLTRGAPYQRERLNTRIERYVEERRRRQLRSQGVAGRAPDRRRSRRERHRHGRCGSAGARRLRRRLAADRQARRARSRSRAKDPLTRICSRTRPTASRNTCAGWATAMRRRRIRARRRTVSSMSRSPSAGVPNTASRDWSSSVIRRCRAAEPDARAAHARRRAVLRRPARHADVATIEEAYRRRGFAARARTVGCRTAAHRQCLPRRCRPSCASSSTKGRGASWTAVAIEGNHGDRRGGAAPAQPSAS